MALNEVPLGPGFVIEAQGRALADVPLDELRALYRQCGFLWLRGFDVAVDQFFLFGRRFMHRVKTTPEPDRRPHPLHRGLQSVNTGLQAMNFHADFGQLPNRPEVISFYCQKPPASGGETFVTDGVALWKALSDDARAQFEKQRIRLISFVDPRVWGNGAGTYDVTAVKEGMEKSMDVTVTDHGGGMLGVEWKTWAAFKPKFSDELALCTNLFPFVYNGLIALWEDGTQLSQPLLKELHAKATQLSTPIVWRSGDFVMVDNTRYLHARAAQDAQRKVYSLQGYLNFE